MTCVCLCTIGTVIILWLYRESPTEQAHVIIYLHSVNVHQSIVSYYCLPSLSKHTHRCTVDRSIDYTLLCDFNSNGYKSIVRLLYWSSSCTQMVVFSTYSLVGAIDRLFNMTFPVSIPPHPPTSPPPAPIHCRSSTVLLQRSLTPPRAWLYLEEFSVIAQRSVVQKILQMNVYKTRTL